MPTTKSTDTSVSFRDLKFKKSSFFINILLSLCFGIVNVYLFARVHPVICLFGLFFESFFITLALVKSNILDNNNFIKLSLSFFWRLLVVNIITIAIFVSIVKRFATISGNENIFFCISGIITFVGIYLSIIWLIKSQYKAKK